MIEYKIKGDTLIVALEGELDHSSAPQVRDELDELLGNRHVKKLVLDFSRLAFMDSSGLGVLMGRYRILTQRGGQMMIKNVSSTMDRILNLSGMYSLVQKL